MSWESSLDAWKTREPVERRFEEELVWRVDGYSPRVDKPVDLGEHASEADAQRAGQEWVLKMSDQDPEYAVDYWFDVHEHDLLENCSCYGKLDRWCPVHGQDPDDARDDRLER